MPQRRELVHIRLGESVFCSECFPTSWCIGHSRLEWERPAGWRALRSHTEVRGNLWPKPAPSEEVAIRNVVGLAVRCRSGRRPEKLFGEQSSVRYVCQSIPLFMRTGKDKWLGCVATQ